MKLIFKIAKNELRNMFYSPVAWFLILVFLVICGFTYSNYVFGISKLYEGFYKNFPAGMVSNLLDNSMSDNIRNNLFDFILQYLYLFVPLLTMSIISREYNTGTIRLLYTSPVKLRQVVFGKYLAIMIFNLIFVFILCIFYVSMIFDVKSPVYGPFFSATLGMYLLLCAFTAIGFFMSSLTTYQTISAIASFTILFALTYIGGLWQQYPFVRDLTYFLSINNRIEKMLAGLIRTKDILYYLVIIYMFVAFTLLKLDAQRRSRPWYIQAARYMAISISGLLIGYIGSRPRLTGYLDLTPLQVNTIRPETQQNLRALDDSELDVTVYCNLFKSLPGHSFMQGGWFVRPTDYNTFLDGWESYIRFRPDIKFKYEYYYYASPSEAQELYHRFPGKTLQQIVGIGAKLMMMDSAIFKSPQEIRIENKDLDRIGYNPVIQLQYKGRKAFFFMLPPYGHSTRNGDAEEPMMNAALKRLSGAKMPKLAFVTGELERNILKSGEREYRNQIYNMVPLGFDYTMVNLARQDSASALSILLAKDTTIDKTTRVDKVSIGDSTGSALNSFVSNGAISSDVTTVVLADPKVEFTPVALSKLKNYLDNGGNMLILGEPKKQQILNPLLRQLGVQLMPGQLVQPSTNETPEKVKSYQTPLYWDLAKKYGLRLNKEIWARDGYDYFENIFSQVMRSVVPISYTRDSGFRIQLLMTTKPINKANGNPPWLKTGKLVLDSVAPVFNAQEGDTRQDSFATVIQLTRQIKGKEQRIILCGDADFISNGNGLATDNSYVELYSWLNDNRFPVYAKPLLSHFPPDNTLIIGPKRAFVQKIVYSWVLPAILLLLASVILLRRKRK
jgi:gliding motility-associated transport system permease protein/gliding motility-associatede transport system auxiliary component